MGTIEQADAVSAPTEDPTPTTGAAPAGLGSVRVLALGLWCVVGSLLTYGVVQTVVKAGALFGS